MVKERELSRYTQGEIEVIRGDLLASAEGNLGEISEERAEDLARFSHIPGKIVLSPKNISTCVVSFNESILTLVDFSRQKFLNLHIHDDFSFEVINGNAAEIEMFERKDFSVHFQIRFIGAPRSENREPVSYHLFLNREYSLTGYHLQIGERIYVFDSQGSIDSLIHENFVYLQIHEAVDPRISKSFYLSHVYRV